LPTQALKETRNSASSTMAVRALEFSVFLIARSGHVANDGVFNW
jgi:hypothetical protein